jgi:hypothetical protein
MAMADSVSCAIGTAEEERVGGKYLGIIKGWSQWQESDFCSALIVIIRWNEIIHIKGEIAIENINPKNSSTVKESNLKMVYFPSYILFSPLRNYAKFISSSKGFLDTSIF